MRPDRVVVLAPLLNDDLGFLETVEDLPVEQFVAEFSVEAFAIAILPRASGLDVEGLGTDVCQPDANDLGRRCSPTVAPSGSSPQLG